MERSVAGNILIEALFAGIVISATAAAFISHMNTKQKDIATEKVRLGLLGVETNLRQNLLDDQAWALTVKSPANAAAFECAQCVGLTCLPTAVTQFRPLDGSGNIVQDGVNEIGTACDAATSNCLFEAVTTWKPICPGGVNCVPTQAEISIAWSQPSGPTSKIRTIRIPGLQKIFKNFPPVPVNAFSAATLMNADLKVSDCACGTQAVGDRFKIDLPTPGQFLSVQMCQPKGYSPPGQAAYRLSFCGERGAVAPCDLTCDNGYVLVQTIPFDVPPNLGNPGYPGKIGNCENPAKAAATPSIVSIVKNDPCPFGSMEQSSTPLDIGAETVIIRFCTTPR